jgi:hypothetical protein
VRRWARAMDPAKRKLAEGWGLNVDSPTTSEILDRLDMSVAEFVGSMRKGSILRELPAEVLDSTLREALDSGDPKVRKLVLDRRWRR